MEIGVPNVQKKKILLKTYEKPKISLWVTFLRVIVFGVIAGEVTLRGLDQFERGFQRRFSRDYSYIS